MSRETVFGVFFSLHLILSGAAALTNYKAALSKTFLFYESQRSGKLPRSQRVMWRGDSGLKDGSDVGLNLVGGYYDAGDNVKFGFPMAFTVTMLSWSTLEYGSKLKANRELRHALEAIKWGTDYIMKAHPQPELFYGGVGDGYEDHQCWQRPEDMTTSRTSMKIDNQNPGADLAGESAAALAAASLAFRSKYPAYSAKLLKHSKQLFDFASKRSGQYQNSIPKAGGFYPSSGFQDELSWAAVWLHLATNEKGYLDYLESTGNPGGTRTMFSWDDKYVGVQLLVAKLNLEKKTGNSSWIWAQYRSQGEQFLCSLVQKGSNNVKKTPGGLLWWQPWNNLQYTTAATFVAAVYSDYLRASGSSIQCPSGTATFSDLDALVKSQADYILGSNPSGMSYMVGYGSKYPTHIHHRAASIVSIKKNPAHVECKGGFEQWFNTNAPDSNVLDGAVVGGPDANDGYTDSRTNYQQSEPATVNTAPLVGVLARLA